MKTRASLWIPDRKGKKVSPTVRKATALERGRSAERKNLTRKVALMLPVTPSRKPIARQTSPDIAEMHLRARLRKVVEGVTAVNQPEIVYPDPAKGSDHNSEPSAPLSEPITEPLEDSPPILQNESLYEVETQPIGFDDTIPDIVSDNVNVYMPVDSIMEDPQPLALDEDDVLLNQEEVSIASTTPPQETSSDQSEPNTEELIEQASEESCMRLQFAEASSVESEKAPSEIDENIISFSCESINGRTPAYWAVKVSGLTQVPFLRSIAEIKAAANELPEVDQIMQFCHDDKSVFFKFYTNLLKEDIPEPPQELVNKLHTILQLPYSSFAQQKQIKCSQILWTR